MRFSFVSLFPDMCRQALAYGVVGRALSEDKLSARFIDIRDFSKDRHKRVDDTPYGGGPGMVLMAEPVVEAVESLGIEPQEAKFILLSARGKRFDQATAACWAKEKELVFICGRYEGIDERVSEVLKPEEISVGDFVLSGGELAALTMADAVARLLPGVLGDDASSEDESFSGQDPMLEYPQYTKPRNFRGHEVPEILLNGNHEAIAIWRKNQSRERTHKIRPDLLNVV